MSVYFNYGLSQNRILIIMTDWMRGWWLYGAASLKKNGACLCLWYRVWIAFFSALFLVRWCGRLVGKDLVEDYNAFRVERRGGWVSRRRQTIKWDCGELTANLLPKRRGGGEIMKISRGLMRGSNKFYHDTTVILNPTTPSPSDDYQWPVP